MTKNILYTLSVLVSIGLVAGSLTNRLGLSFVEVMGFISGGLCVWLTVKENIWNWPIGIINSFFFLVLFWKSSFFADSLLQVIYIVLGFLGWYWWLYGGEGKKELHIENATVRTFAVLMLIAVPSTWAMTVYLRSVQDAAPFWDALTTVFSLVAQYLLTKKLIENWYVWILVDVIYVPLYFYKELYLTAMIYLVFLAMCFAGLAEWKKLQSKKTEGASISLVHEFDTGLVVGKFYPPHAGHSFLIETAKRHAKHVTVLVCDLPEQKIRGALRAEWIRKSHPDVAVLIVPDIRKDDDSKAWADYTVKILGYVPDAVFTSEAYGDAYAKYMGSRHISVDRVRATVPISATKVRKDPLGNFAYLSPDVRAFFVKRVCVLGAESTGTTTMAKSLAEHYRTVWVPEFGRTYWEGKMTGADGVHWDTREFEFIAEEQNKMEDEFAKIANKILILDTDSFATTLWHERYMGFMSETVDSINEGRACDLYLLTDVDIPFVQDGTRDGEDIRVGMHERFVDEFKRRGKPYIVLSGTHEERLRKAIAACDEVLKRNYFAEPMRNKRVVSGSSVGNGTFRARWLKKFTPT